jgi:hypothetical protein
MRRQLALLVVLAALGPMSAGAAEPLDLDLSRLGAPTGSVWSALLQAQGLSTSNASQLAADSRVRFARLTSDLALAVSSSLLQPASTTGASGFHVDLEGSYTGVSADLAGAQVPGTAYPANAWPTHGPAPHELFIPSVHVRKAFPFSLELGGRLEYLSQSSYYAAQLEGKWALMEGFWVLPDVAVRASYTMLLGQRDLNLSTTEFDLVVSRRIGVNAVSSVTPYLAARFALLSASTSSMAFFPDFNAANNPVPRTPDVVQSTSAAFPTLNALLYRTTAGVRLTAYAVSMAAEVTFYTGGKGGKSGAADNEYPSYSVPASVGGAVKFGFEF